jgi:hypothetical protein
MLDFYPWETDYIVERTHESYNDTIVFTGRCGFDTLVALHCKEFIHEGRVCEVTYTNTLKLFPLYEKFFDLILVVPPWLRFNLAGHFPPVDYGYPVASEDLYFDLYGKIWEDLRASPYWNPDIIKDFTDIKTNLGDILAVIGKTGLEI